MPTSFTHREHGQTVVLFAVTLIALLAGMALVFDAGNLLIQRRVAQDAADAGALAGSRALALGATDAVIRDTITSYAGGASGPWAVSVAVVTNSYYVDATNTSMGNVGDGTPALIPAGIHVDVSRTIPATFSNVIGIRTLTGTGTAAAATGIGPVDVMLALDTTGSMDTPGFKAEQNAVHDFVKAMKLVINDPNSVQIGMARFQGAVCDAADWSDATWSCTGTPWDDATVLSQLSANADALITIACGPATAGGNNCPNDYATSIACSSLSLPTPLSWDGDTSWSSSGKVAPYGCPLAFVNNHATKPYEIVGTKLANAFNVMHGTLTGEKNNHYWAWTDTARPTARKVLVMMTDGDDNSPMADSAIVATAAALKTNAAGNVSIYTMGYYASGVSNITVGSPPYACPGSVFPPVGITVTATDQLMHDLSSSGANDCQFYAPLLKSDNNLPAAFLKIAGKIQAGRLTN